MRRRSLVHSVLLLLASAVGGQQEFPGTFSEVLEVRVVNVEVVVTDRQGNRVEELKIEDFRLRVDGEEVPIEYFTEVRAGSAILGGESAPKQIPTLDPGEGVGTSYLVFIDEFFSIARDRDRILERMRAQLPQLGIEDRMAVVAYDGQGLEMLSTWSRSVEALDEVFRDAIGRKAYGMQRHAERRSEELFLRDVRFRTGGDFSRLETEERYYVSRIESQVERVVSAAASTLRSFAAPPGRKVMLLLSGGWPYDPVQWVVDDIGRLVSEPGIKVGADLLSPLSDTANLLGYTLYTVDIPGMQVSALDRSIGAQAANVPDSLTGLSFNRETDLHHSLNFLASETGGRALLNAKRDDLFSIVVADTRTYYWIGYSPQRKGDDKRHKVEVEVLRPGLEVRSREGFFDFSRSREVNMAIESALYFGNPPSPQPLVIQIGRPQKAGRRMMVVPLAVAIPTDAITLLPSGPESYAARLELRVAVLDEDGASTDDIPVVPLELTLGEKPKPGRFLRYDTHLKMRRKPHDLVVALYDTPSGTILSTAVEVSPN